jgi:hypothetical protein
LKDPDKKKKSLSENFFIFSFFEVGGLAAQRPDGQKF